MDLKKLLSTVIEKQASDLHLTVAKPPTLRIDDKLTPIAGEVALDFESAKKLILQLLTSGQKEKLEMAREIDFSYSFNNKGRFRVNVYFQKGELAAALRLIPTKIRTLRELGLPESLSEFAKAQQGFFLSVGPAGHGKTTTCASLVDIINHSRTDHIITIEDPIEYVFTADKCLIDQREVGQDTNSFPRALRSCLRQDPDVIFVGEMRDYETIATAATLAETGHLVISTLHTNNASQTIDRMVDVFPPYQQQQIRFQIANTLLGIVSQRLIPKIKGGRIVACEIMKATPAVRNLIREGKTYQLDNIIQTSQEEGMIPLDLALMKFVQNKIIRYEDGLAYALDRKNFERMVK
ncbi:MAG: PilT/PilU family type 4a pilus ATPase [Patescibacteria group bacterium]